MDMRHVHPFMEAMDTGQVDALAQHLSAEVVLHSPFVPDPVTGRAEVMKALNVLLSATDKYTTDAIVEGEDRAAIIFRISAGDVEVSGVDDMRVDDVGRIASMTVQWRPLAGVVAIQQKMAPLLGVPAFALVERQD